MYIDIHTHQHAMLPGQIAIVNSFPETFPLTIKPEERYSCGIHPWNVADWKSSITPLQTIAGQKRLVAIGECGLDVYSGLQAEQEAAFRFQIELSEQYQLPLILHCVRAYNEAIRIRKNMHITQPWIFHGYQSSPEVTTQLLKLNKVYFSFGEALFKPVSKAWEAARTLPLDRLFLETDESHRPITEVYTQLAAIRKCLVEEITQQLEVNFEMVLNESLVRARMS